MKRGRGFFMPGGGRHAPRPAADARQGGARGAGPRPEGAGRASSLPGRGTGLPPGGAPSPSGRGTGGAAYGRPARGTDNGVTG